MPSQGPLSPSTIVDDAAVGTRTWANPGNAASSNNSYAVAGQPGSVQSSHYLKATGFGFSIPAGATIQGIVVEVERKGTDALSAVDIAARLVKAGTVQATDRSTGTAFPATDAYATYGSSSDLWGTTWTPAQINATDFGFVFQANIEPLKDAFVDHIRITVTYAITTEGAVAISAVGSISVVGLVRAARITAAGSVTVTGRGPDYGLRAYLGLPGLTELTPRLRSFTITRGRPSNLERVQAGVASTSFKNGDGAPLDPGNPDSIYYPYVRVLTEVALARRQGGVVYDRFRGRIERIIPTWLPPDYQEQEIVAADAFEALSTLTLESGKATLQTLIAGPDNDLVFTAKEAGGRGDELTIEYVVAGNNTALAGDTNEPLTGGALFDESFGSYAWYLANVAAVLGSGTTPPPPPPKFEVRGSDITIQLSTNASGGSTTTATQIKTLIEATPELAALVTVEIAPGNTGAGIVTAMPKTNLAGGKWPQEKTGARINRALDIVGWPATLRRIDPGLFDVVAQGFGPRDNTSALSHIQDVASSENGYVFIAKDGYVVYHDGGHRGRDARSTVSQATFADAAAGAGYFYSGVSPEYSKDKVYNRVSVTAGYPGAEPQVTEDAASQLLYSPVPGVAVPRDYTKTTLLANDADALTVAQAILAAYKDARVRFESIRLLERDDPAGWTEAVMNRELGDRVTIRTKPPAHTSVGVYECFVEQITEKGQPGSPVEITFALSLATESVEIPPPSGGSGAVKDSSGDDFVLDSGTAGVLG